MLTAQELDTGFVEDINCSLPLESNDSNDDNEYIHIPQLDVGLNIKFEFTALIIGDSVVVKFILI